MKVFLEMCMKTKGDKKQRWVFLEMFMKNKLLTRFCQEVDENKASYRKVEQPNQAGAEWKLDAAIKQCYFPADARFLHSRCPFFIPHRTVISTKADAYFSPAGGHYRAFFLSRQSVAAVLRPPLLESEIPAVGVHRLDVLHLLSL